ncbi:hypothetical protein TcasGA2_TC033040 [Tribolium castaneum]|uniref:Uncharacterized protein n=1 Tax=Tribolium castaneum TaxID=7070 RepID=A0A139WHX7_TRICA|nr:hypothetical protein TcasGA2_TC033040 [Tribolium castaneum]
MNSYAFLIIIKIRDIQERKTEQQAQHDNHQDQPLTGKAAAVRRSSCRIRRFARSVITFENGQCDDRNPNLVIINDTEPLEQIPTKNTNQSKETTLNNSRDLLPNGESLEQKNNSRKLSLQLPNNLIKNVSTHKFVSNSNPDSPIIGHEVPKGGYNSTPPSPTKSTDALSMSSIGNIYTKNEMGSLASFDSCKKLEKNMLGSEPNISFKDNRDQQFPSLNDLSFNFTSLAAQKILKGVGLNSVDTLVELNMTANLDKQNNCDVVHTDFGIPTINGAGGSSTKIFVQNSPVRSVITFENGQCDDRNPNLVIINDTEPREQIPTKNTNQSKETTLNNSRDLLPNGESLEQKNNNSRKLSLQLPNNLIKNVSTHKFVSNSNPDSPIIGHESTDALSMSSIGNIYTKNEMGSLASFDSCKKLEKNTLGSEPNISFKDNRDQQFPSLNDLSFNFTSLAAQKILKGVGLNSVDTLVELNMTANLDKQNNCDVVHTDFGIEKLNNKPNTTTTKTINEAGGSSTKMFVQNSPVRSVITFENGQCDDRNPNLVIINDTEPREQIPTKNTNQSKETTLNNSRDLLPNGESLEQKNNSRKLSLQLPNNLIKNVSTHKFVSNSNPDSPIIGHEVPKGGYNSTPPSPTKSTDALSMSSIGNIYTKNEMGSLASFDSCKKLEKNMLGSEPNISFKNNRDQQFPSLNDLSFNFTSLAAQKILKEVGLNSVDTLVELNMTANLDKQNNCDVVHTDFGMF